MLKSSFTILVILSCALLSCNRKQPVACFVDPSEPLTAGIQHEFVDCSVDAESYEWTFGDGSASSEPSPIHTYKSTGEYLVSLTVGKKKKTDILERLIQVKAIDLTSKSAGTYTGSYTEVYRDSSALDTSYKGNVKVSVIDESHILVTFNYGTFNTRVSGNPPDFSLAQIEKLTSTRLTNVTASTGFYQNEAKQFTFTIEGTDVTTQLKWNIQFSGIKP